MDVTMVEMSAGRMELKEVFVKVNCLGNESVNRMVVRLEKMWGWILVEHWERQQADWKDRS
jgi:hypothetical protein